MATRSWRQGYFKPRNPQKYVGDVDNIRYMSSWEREVFRVLDGNPNILRWSSETVAIPYVKPTDQKVHKYYPDLWIEYKDKHGQIVREIIEIKPQSQIEPPKKAGKNKKQQLQEQVTYAINCAKWQYAKKFCDQHGLHFRVLSEQQLFA